LRIPFVTELIPPCFLLVGFSFLAESRSWFIMKGRPDEVAASFRRSNAPIFGTQAATTVTVAAVAQEQQQELARIGSA
jgi:hypothetical protein